MPAKYMLIAGTALLIMACAKQEGSTPQQTQDNAAAQVSVSEAAEKTESAAEPGFDASAAPTGVYKNDPGHSYIAFSYNHMGYSNPIARWGSWTADLNWNSEDPAQSSIAATIDAASIDTGVAELDDHLRSPDFFEVEKFPTISFASTSLEVTGSDAARLIGDLTIKGVTKPVAFDVKINKAADDDFAKAYKIGFSAKGMIKRSDFGVDLYTPMVGDDISFTIEVEFIQPKDLAGQ